MNGFIRFFRRIIRVFYTWLCKRRLAKYGAHLGVNGLSIISNKAIVEVGDYVNFNGMRIIGWGGKNRVSFSFWIKCKDYVGFA